MNNKEKAILMRLDPCNAGAEWASEAKTLREAWDTCERSDWMIWALRRIGFKDDRKYRLWACACVRGTPLADGRVLWDLLTDPRSRAAVEIAERFANGDASDSERAMARNAADAAAYAAAAAAAADAAAYAADDAAAYAAYAAADAKTKARNWQADLLRQWISWDEIAPLIK